MTGETIDGSIVGARKKAEHELETRFPHHFQHLGHDFTLTIRDFGTDSEDDGDKWIQVAVTMEPKTGRFQRLFSTPQPIDVGRITLKPHSDGQSARTTYEIMGNYNHTYGKRDHVKGAISVAIQELVRTTNWELFVTGVTHGGEMLYERMISNHDPSLTVAKEGIAYWIKPKDL